MINDTVINRLSGNEEHHKSCHAKGHGIVGKLDDDRKRAEIYAVNAYLKSMELERYAALRSDVSTELLSDISWGSEYSSDEQSALAPIVRRKLSGNRIGKETKRVAKSLKPLSVSGLGGV